MRTAVVHPRDPVRDHNIFLEALGGASGDGAWFAGEFSSYEPELLALASGLRQAGEDAHYLDLNLGDRFVAGDWQRVVIGGVVCQSEEMRELAARCRQQGVECLLGGPWANLQTDQALTCASAVIRGSLAQAVGLLSGSPLGLQGILAVDAASPVADLDPLLLGDKRPPLYPLLASRGCPRACAFCTVAARNGAGFRRPPAGIRRELERVLARDPSASIVFLDDNMAADRDWLQALCQELEPLGVFWSTHADGSLAGDEETLTALARAGCRRVFLGLESLSGDALRRFSPWKAAQIPSYGEWMDAFARAGIGTLVSFILGLDGEGDAVAAIRQFVRRHPPRALSLSLLTPMPGTELYRRMEAEGRIRERCLSRYTQFFPVMDFGPGGEAMLSAATALLTEFHSSPARRERIRYWKRRYRRD